MTLLLDIGNTHTHAGLASSEKIQRHMDVPTGEWMERGRPSATLLRWVGSRKITQVAICSVVPSATSAAVKLITGIWGLTPFVLTSATVTGVGLDYPKPHTIGADRLANAIAAKARYGSPSVVVDFGTAVTFDVLDRRGCYVGGVIAPGLAAMTDYLHEKTALLPRITIRDIKAVVGKSTEEAMLIGAVHGYRGLIRELAFRLKRQLKCRLLPLIATGGYARLMAAGLPEITAVDPLLTLEGLRLAAAGHTKGVQRVGSLSMPRQV
ncbi:MAG: type III pantothenate kinase [Verrucomicrobia bacterium]|nr:type III pantothenate kinase [Verrucomicrobiota bacterium]